MELQDLQLETAVETSAPWDRLSRNVKRVATRIRELERDRDELEDRVRDLEGRCRAMERKLERNPDAGLTKEVERLRAAERAWDGERREIADQIDQLAERIEQATD